jgi:signal transduction histidine kinase
MVKNMGLTVALVSELDVIGDWGLLATDSKLLLTSWNRWLEIKTGIPASTVIGKSLFEVFPELVSRRIGQYYSQALGGQTVILSQRFHKYIFPMNAVLSGDRIVQMQQTVRIVPIIEVNSSICGTLTMIDDVTERVVVEGELRDRLEQLAEVDRRKDEFLAMLAHELRNPLAPISNTLQVFKLKFAGQKGFEHATTVMERQLDHITRLVDDLLDVSRINRGKFELRKQWVDLKVILERAVVSIQTIVTEKRHYLEIEVPQEAVGLEADPDRLEQILVNLMTNAAKYTPPGGLIKVGIQVERNEAVVRVSDNGIGIRPEMMPRLFELFQQADRVPGRVSEGLGIGLSLVRTLTEMHGGSASASSPGPSQGSEFVVRLPLCPPSAIPSRADDQAESPIKPRRILVTDDNIDAADSLAELLAILGHEVRTANDGHQALIEATKFSPDLIILDIGLPNGMDGYELAQRLRRLPGHEKTTLVAVTGYGSSNDIARAKRVGFDHHLTKPVAFDALTDLLHSMP